MGPIEPQMALDCAAHGRLGFVVLYSQGAGSAGRRLDRNLNRLISGEKIGFVWQKSYIGR
jgi:hypothetical protein